MACVFLVILQQQACHNTLALDDTAKAACFAAWRPNLPFLAQLPVGSALHGV